MPPPGAALRRNPLYDASGAIRWPSERYAAGIRPARDLSAARPMARSARSPATRRSTTRPGGACCSTCRSDGEAVRLGHRRLRLGRAGLSSAPGDPGSAQAALVRGLRPRPAARDAGPPCSPRSRARPGSRAFLADRAVTRSMSRRPNHAHRAVVEAAARAGMPVLCEKPMATTLADAEAMVGRRRARRRRATPPRSTSASIAAHRRWPGRVARGPARHGDGDPHRLCVLARRPDWAGDNWRIDPRRAGGGALIDLAPHGLDLASTTCWASRWSTSPRWARRACTTTRSRTARC